MTIWQAIVLGIIQGLTEFLPISSSGHLVLVPWLFHWEIFHHPALNKTFDVALHFGTFLGVAVYFRREIWRLIRGWLRSIAQRSMAGDPYRRLSWLVLISTVPGAAAGVMFEDVVEQKLGAPLLIGALLIGVGVVLAIAEWAGKHRRDLESVGWADGIIIGLAQAVALAPGTSRSGITIAVGLFGNLRREAAARYSFLISIPIIGGAAAAKGAQLARHGLPGGMEWPFVFGVLSAAVSGYLVIRLFLSYLQRGTLYPFVAYRIAVGALVVYLATRAVL
jgi:undecaprenyl-diphosphatase